MSNLYSALIVSSTDKGAEFIHELLTPDKYEAVSTAKNAGEAKRMLITRNYDLIIIKAPLTDEFGTDFAVDICQNTQSCALILVKNDQYEQTLYQAEPYGVLTLSKPMTKQTLYASLGLMCATRERLKKLEKKNESLEEKMAEIRVVNRAKWVLIDYLKMTETQAHRFIEKKAMDMRLTKKAAAEAIIRTYDN